MDLITNFLIEEGFASDVSSANAILSVMSEEWLESITEELAYRGGEPLPPADQRALENIRRMLAQGSIHKTPTTTPTRQTTTRKKRKLQFEVR